MAGSEFCPILRESVVSLSKRVLRVRIGRRYTNLGMGNAMITIAIANVFFLQENPLKSKGYKFNVLDCKEGDREFS